MKQQMTFQSRPGGTWPGAARQRALALAVLVGGLLCLFALGGLHVGAQGLRSPGNPQPFPQPNSHTVPATSTVGIIYDEPISPTTVTSRTFVVQAMQTGQLLATYGVHSGTITLTPTQPLRPGELVQVSATTGTLGFIDGTGPLTPTVWQFRAGAPAGSGNFISSGQPFANSLSWAVALGDLDGDNDLDALVGNYTFPSRVWLNDGSGYFVDSGQDLGTAQLGGLALGDLDGDDDLDAFIVNQFGAANTVWFNDGDGLFSNSGQLLGSEHSIDVALADVDGDGDLDAFIANSGFSTVWFNDSHGFFYDSGQRLAGVDSRTVSMGDVDGDSDLDALLINAGLPNQVFLNNGQGFFSDSAQALSSGTTRGGALGDVDGDGDLDALLGKDGQPDEVWLNNGAGQFTDSGQRLGNARVFDLVVGDVDGDGDLDFYTANADFEADSVWLNDGMGNFVSGSQTLSTAYGLAAALGDLNGDGDLDVFVGASSSGNAVWLNDSPPVLSDIVVTPMVLEDGLATLTGRMSELDEDDQLTLTVGWGDGWLDEHMYGAGTTFFTLTHRYLDDEPTNTPFDENLIQLLLQDRDGGQDAVTTTLFVYNVVPQLADLSLTTPLNEHDTLTLSGRIVDPSPLDTFTLVVIWETGAQVNYHYPAGTTQFSESHQYLDDNPSGTPVDPITITLILVDDDTGTAVETLGGEIHNLPPVVVAGADQSGTAGQPLDFTGSFSDVGTLDTHTVQWDFGDGSAPVSGTLTPTHTFAAAGSYTVRLTVTDDDTGVGEDTLTVTVMPASYPLFFPFIAHPAAVAPPIPGRAALPPRQLFQ